VAGKSDIEAGKAFVTLYVKNSPLLKGINVVKAELQGLGTSVMKLGGVIGAIGTAITAPIMGAVNQFVGMGTELQNISRRTGLGVQALAEFRHAAEQTGAALGDVEGASKSVTKNIADAAMGGQGAAIALSRLGLTAEGLKKQLPQDQLQTVIDKLKDVKDPAQQAALATQLLGGTNLLPMIGQLGALRKEARDLGLAPSEKAVADAANLGRMLKRGLSVVTATIFEIGSAVGPVLFPLGDAFIRITASVAKWVKENGEIIRTVFKIGSIVAAVGTAIAAVGAAIFGVGTVVGMVGTAISGIITAIGSIITIATTIGSLLAPIIVPLLLITGAVGGLTALLLRNQSVWNAVSTTAKGTLKSIVDAVMPYVQIVKDTIGGIVDALMSGEIGLAGQIAMTALKLAFETAKLAIVGSWLDLRNRVLGVWDKIIVGASGAMAFVGSLWKTLVEAIMQTELGTYLSSAWTAFKVAAVAAFDYILSYAKALIAALNVVRSIIWQTIKDVSIAVPAVAKAAGGVALAQGKPLAAGIQAAGLEKAFLDAAAAMKKAGEERDQMAQQREADANEWLIGQEQVKEELKEQLAGFNALAKDARANVKAGGAGDVPAGQVPRAGEIAEGAALRATAVTFSGAALGLLGNDGGMAKRQLKAQEEARDLQKKQLAAQEKNAQAADKLVNLWGMA
jgi:hypothetical protein